MHIQTRNLFPHMYVYAALPEVDGVYNAGEISDLIEEFQDLINTLEWAKGRIAE